MNEDNRWLDDEFSKYHAANNLLNANEKNYSDDELLQAFLEVENKLKAAIQARIDQVVREARRDEHRQFTRMGREITWNEIEVIAIEKSWWDRRLKQLNQEPKS